MSENIQKKFEVWGSTNSCFELSLVLASLNVSHSISRWGAKNRIVNLKHEQPHWVHLCTDVKQLEEDAINFLVASRPELELNRITVLSNGEASTIKKVLSGKRVAKRVAVVELSAAEYVAAIAKPSLLNKVQTVIMGIQPYSLRKEINSLVLDYFNSKASLTSAVRVLKRSYKTEGLIGILQEGEALRKAVSRLKKEGAEAVALDTGLSSFDLLYLSKSRKTIL